MMTGIRSWTRAKVGLATVVRVAKVSSAGGHRRSAGLGKVGLDRVQLTPAHAHARRSLSSSSPVAHFVGRAHSPAATRRDLSLP